MNILILNGGTRKSSNTTQILKYINEGISNNHKVDWVDVNTLSLKPCIGCLKCRPDKECIFKEDDGHIIGRKLKEAEALIMGSPTYFGNITGPLKTLIDRILPAIEYLPGNEFVLPKKLHKGQKAIIVTASNSPWPIKLLPSQAGGTMRAMKTILKNGGYKLAGSINFGSSILIGKIPDRTKNKARKLGSKIK